MRKPTITTEKGKIFRKEKRCFGNGKAQVKESEKEQMWKIWGKITAGLLHLGFGTFRSFPSLL